MRLAYYAGASTAAAAACLLKAFHQRPNFYSATVYLSQSNACLLVLTNLILVMVCSFIYGLQRLLYGPLRPIEIEQLSEKAWYAVLDTLLAMPSFREDVGGWLLAMFTLLLAGKVWGWIGEGRVDVLEQQPPANPRLFHLRLATSLIVSVVFDIWMLDYCAETVLRDPRPGMMVIFTFEFAILSVFSMFTLFRYALNVFGIWIEAGQLEKAIEERKEEIKAERAAARQNEAEDGRPAPADPPSDEPIEVDENEVDVPGWENKRRYLFGLEVITDFIKLLIYILFFTVSVTFNGLPMHIMRDVYMTFASFSKRVGDYMAYRKATSDMNTRYPDATTEEIRGDSCIVCRETMVAWEQPAAQQEAQPADRQPEAAPAPSRRRDEGLRAKKLPCGHILHLRCLKAWLERQQVCPTCRRPVVTADTPAPPAQPGAPDAAHGQAPGQQPQQPPRRQNRARIFDLGPVRIGFVNGPGANIGNIVRQMQNPNAAAAQNANQQNQNQQGQNRAALQDPYVQAAHNANMRNQGQPNAAVSTPSTPVQMGMLQLEQRMMQQARNYNIEQQQYGVLRAMEAELARLRALHTPEQQPVGIENAAAQRHSAQPAPLVPVNNPWTGQPDLMTPVRDVLHVAGQPQTGNDQNGLPEGMVLPEGWTVTPLQHVYAAGMPLAGSHLPPNTLIGHPLNQGIPVPIPAHPIYQGVPVAGNAAPQQSSNANQTAPTALGQGVPPAESISAAANAEPQPSDTTHTAQAPGVPVDDNGSPLFVPAVAGEAGNDAPAQASQAPATQSTPWGSEGWSFSNGDHANGHAVTSQQTSSSTQESSNQQSESHRESADEEDSSKKTVQVEDVPDEGT